MKEGASVIQKSTPTLYNSELPEPSLQWWQRSWLVLLASFLSAIPFFYPATPPLIDFPGHLGRYAIQMGLAGPEAQTWYQFEWALVGNLGVDLLIELFTPLFGLELGAKIIIACIPGLQVLGFLLVSKEVHGRIQPTALFAAPLAYSFPLHFGFVNFMLAVALCFIALALWIRLGKLGHFRLRIALFLPLSFGLWITHTFGYGMFGILAFSCDVYRYRDKGLHWPKAISEAVIQCLCLTGPLMVMGFSRSDGAGLGMREWFKWDLKLSWIFMILRDRWGLFDRASLVLLMFVAVSAALLPGFRWRGPLGLAACLFAGLFLLLPIFVFGSAYADMRLAPFGLACALLTVGVNSSVTLRQQSIIAFAALAFFAIRTSATTVSFALFNKEHEAHLKALDHIPKNTRLITFVQMNCEAQWKMQRTGHLPAMALVRRGAFANDQWALDGALLVKVKYLQGSNWTSDPSQLTSPPECLSEWTPTAKALQDFPKESFDYVWLVGKSDGVKVNAKQLKLVWQGQDDQVYKVIPTQTGELR